MRALSYCLRYSVVCFKQVRGSQERVHLTEYNKEKKLSMKAICRISSPLRRCTPLSCWRYGYSSCPVQVDKLEDLAPLLT